MKAREAVVALSLIHIGSVSGGDIHGLRIFKTKCTGVEHEQPEREKIPKGQYD
jgi:hypothetical protein